MQRVNASISRVSIVRSFTLALVVALFCSPNKLNAQVPNPATSVGDTNASGERSFATISASQIDHVDYGTGGSGLNIPITANSGRGLGFSLNVNYSSKFWNPAFEPGPDGGFYWKIETGRRDELGWEIGTAWLSSQPNTQQCTDFFADSYKNGFVFHDVSGVMHAFDNETPFCGNVGNKKGYSTDTTGMMLLTPVINGPHTLYLQNGTKYIFKQISFSPDIYLPDIVDTNGNEITSSWVQGAFPAGQDTETWTDTVGRQVAVLKWGPSQNYVSPQGVTLPWARPLSSITVSDSNGNFQTYTFIWRAIDLVCPFSDGSCLNFPPQQTGLVLTQITLPNNQSYRFSYQYPNGAYNGGGELTRIDLPTGGYIRYEYQGLLNAENSASAGAGMPSRVISKRVESPDGSTEIAWLYSYSRGCTPFCVSQKTTTVTDPQGNQQIYTFLPMDAPLNTQFFEVSREFRQGSTTVLRRVDQTWENDTIHCFGSGAIPCTPNVNFRVKNQTTTLPGSNQTTQVTTSYDSATVVRNTRQGTFTDVISRGNVVQTQEYDFGVGAPGALLRTTARSYLGVNPANNVDYTADNLHIWDHMTSETVIGADGNVKAQTINSYDNTTLLGDLGGAPNHDGSYSTAFNIRGNLTQVQHWLFPGNTFITTATNTYDDLGNLRQTTDANGHSTTFDYSDDFPNWNCLIVNSAPQAWVTEVTNALGQKIQSAYYGCTGLPVWTRDQNDINANRVNSSFTYDAMNRISSVSHADGGQTTYFYNDDLAAFPMVYVREDTKLDSSNNITRAWTAFDGIGRKVRFAKYNGEGTANMFDMTDTCYDILGRVSTQNYPFQGAGWSPNPINCAASTGDSFTYDALGRTTRVTHSDGSHVDTNYSQFPTVTVTDEAGKQRQNKTDALGRLIAVWEPDAIGNFNYETDYQYDTLDNLIRVDQKGGDSNPANWRTRTFTYDSLSRLTTATNPESGTITYVYDDAGNLTSKTSPAPNQTGGATVTMSYTYDALNRLTGKTSSDNSHGAYFVYDQTPLWGVDVQNPIGRLVGQYAVVAGVDRSVGSVLSYDMMGRPNYENHFNGHVPTWLNEIFNYTYNLDGSLKTIQYPTGRTVTYSYNAGQRPVSAVDVANNVNYYTGAHYTAFGAPTSMVYGATPSFAGITWSNTYNSRMQPVFLTATASSSTIFSLGYDFHLNSDDNGNVYAVNNNKITDHGRDQSFTYDQFNRLLTAQSAATSGPNCWGESFGYDPGAI